MRGLASLMVVALLAFPGVAQDGEAGGELLDELQVGHWVQVKGALDRRGWFVVSELELLPPEGEEVLVGSVGLVVRRVERFRVMGLPIHVSEKTDWRGLDWDDLSDTRVKVEGHYRGTSKFSARQISLRKGTGRDRLEGRIDSIDRSGRDVVLRIMSFQVLVPADAILKSDVPLASLALAPERDTVEPPDRENDPENYIPISIALTDSLGLGLQLESREAREDNFNLNDAKRGDKRKSRLAAKAVLLWQPREDAFALGRFRWQKSSTRDQDDPSIRFDDGDVAELYGYWRDPVGWGLDVQVGRQDFDEPREWIYDRNLDALRFHLTQPGMRLEVSKSTRLSEGSRASRETENWIVYLSNDNEERHLAAWVVDRQRTDDQRSKPIFGGLRMLGEWLPEQTIWAELSAVRGYEEDVDLRGWGLDVGTTWDLDPFYVSLGFAHGSGDDDPTDDVDTGFRQTGLHDNNGTLGGVTSFKYYGELVQPELGNLNIYTAGVGTRMGRRSSVDLVAHKYQLVETVQLPAGAAPAFRSNLRRRPDGIHDDIGWELDLIFGTRELKDWDLELIFGYFKPGDAFPDADPAWVWRSQIRYRF